MEIAGLVVGSRGAGPGVVQGEFGLLCQEVCTGPTGLSGDRALVHVLPFNNLEMELKGLVRTCPPQGWRGGSIVKTQLQFSAPTPGG